MCARKPALPKGPASASTWISLPAEQALLMLGAYIPMEWFHPIIFSRWNGMPQPKESHA